jgi:hypothetical protein
MLLRILHSIGLTNLSNADVQSLELLSIYKKLNSKLNISDSNVKIKLLPYLERYSKVDINVNELGVIERDMRALKRVIVIADKVEKPHSILEEAVENNFNEGIQYIFLVSTSKAEDELTNYYTIFEARAKIVAKRLNRDVASLLQIKRLPMDWNNYPYILYQCEDQVDNTRLVTYAFRGNELGKGISHYYVSVAGEDAHTIAITVTAEAPSEIIKEVNPTNNRFEYGGRSLRLVTSNSR